jgi:hypothetical protein
MARPFVASKAFWFGVASALLGLSLSIAAAGWWLT